MKSIRSKVLLAAAFALAGGMCFAQSGEAIYSAHCKTCHGAAGTPNPAMAKMPMFAGIKPASDPSVKKLSDAEMEAIVKKGKGNMKPVAGLSDAQVKEVVTYFRQLGKK